MARPETQPFGLVANGRFQLFRVEYEGHPEEDMLIIDTFWHTAILRNASGWSVPSIPRGDPQWALLEPYLRNYTPYFKWTLKNGRYYFPALSRFSKVARKLCTLCRNQCPRQDHWTSKHPEIFNEISNEATFSDLEALGYAVREAPVQRLSAHSPAFLLAPLPTIPPPDSNVQHRSLLASLSTIHSGGQKTGLTTKEMHPLLVSEGWVDMLVSAETRLPSIALSIRSRDCVGFERLYDELNTLMKGIYSKMKEANTSILRSLVGKYDGHLYRAAYQQSSLSSLCRALYWIICVVPWNDQTFQIFPNPGPELLQAIAELKGYLEYPESTQSDFATLLRPIYKWLAWSSLPAFGENGLKGHCKCPLIVATVSLSCNSETVNKKLGTLRRHFNAITWFNCVLGFHEADHIYQAYNTGQVSQSLDVIVLDIVERFLASEAITVAGYLQSRRAPLTSIQWALSGNQIVENCLGTDTLRSNKDELDIVQLKRTLWTLVDSLKGSLWNNICPTSFEESVRQSPVKLYKNDIRVKEFPGRSLIDADYMLTGVDWVSLQAREYLRLSLTENGAPIVGPVHARVCSNCLNGIYDFDRSKCLEMLEEIRQWKLALMAVLYWSSGPPVRITEWREALLFSTHQVARSFYVTTDLDNRPVVAMESAYTKRAYNNFALRRTVRYLEPAVGQLIISYLRFMYPWYLILRTVVLDEDMAWTGADVRLNEDLPPQFERSESFDQQEPELSMPSAQSDDDEPMTTVFSETEDINDDSSDSDSSIENETEPAENAETAATPGNPQLGLVTLPGHLFEHNGKIMKANVLRQEIRARYGAGVLSCRQFLKHIFETQITRSHFRSEQMYKHAMEHVLAHHTEQVADLYYARSPWQLPGQTSSERVEALTLCSTYFEWLFNVNGYLWNSRSLTLDTPLEEVRPDLPLSFTEKMQARAQQLQRESELLRLADENDVSLSPQSLALARKYTVHLRRDLLYTGVGCIDSFSLPLLQKLCRVPVVAVINNPFERAQVCESLNQEQIVFSEAILPSDAQIHVLDWSIFFEDMTTTITFLNHVGRSTGGSCEFAMVYITEASLLLHEERDVVQTLSGNSRTSFILGTDFTELETKQRLLDLFSSRDLEQIICYKPNLSVSYRVLCSSTPIAEILRPEFIAYHQGDTEAHHIVLVWPDAQSHALDELSASMRESFRRPPLLYSFDDTNLEKNVQTALSRTGFPRLTLFVIPRPFSRPVLPRARLVVVVGGTVETFARAAQMLEAQGTGTPAQVIYLPHGLPRPERHMPRRDLNILGLINCAKHGECLRTYIERAAGLCHDADRSQECINTDAVPCASCLDRMAF